VWVTKNGVRKRFLIEVKTRLDWPALGKAGGKDLDAFQVATAKGKIKVDQLTQMKIGRFA